MITANQEFMISRSAKRCLQRSYDRLMLAVPWYARKRPEIIKRVKDGAERIAHIHIDRQCDKYERMNQHRRFSK